ncbi:MAG: glycosyltransferase family A protein [Verrucomicrobiota bacterium]
MLESIGRQTLAPREVIVVDQNPAGWLEDILNPHRANLPLKVVNIPAKGASHARNAGLVLATGPLVGFPDDDCWLDRETLGSVETLFENDPTLAAACLPLHDAGGRPIMLRWPSRRAPVTRTSVWQNCLMAGFYARKPVLDAIGGFDERLGVGTELGSGEETDLALRLLAAGHRLDFIPLDGLRHPQRPPVGRLAERAESYGRGFGYVWTANRLSTFGFYYYCLRALAGRIIASLRGDTGAACFYAASLRGRLTGRRAALNERP